MPASELPPRRNTRSPNTVRSSSPPPTIAQPPLTSAIQATGLCAAHVRQTLEQPVPAGGRAIRVPFRHAHLPEAHGRDEKRERVDDERGVAAEKCRGGAAERRADDQRRRPRARGNRVGHDEIPSGHDVRNRRGACRLEEAARADRHGRDDVGEPDHRWRPDEEEAQDDDPADEIGGDHDSPPIEAIDHEPGGGPDERDRQKLHDHQQRDRRGRADQLEQERVQGDVVEPVAELADDLTKPEQPEVPVVPEQLDDRPHESTRAITCASTFRPDRMMPTWRPARSIIPVATAAMAVADAPSARSRSCEMRSRMARAIAGSGT